jgi:outer membrane protein TolC
VVCVASGGPVAAETVSLDSALAIALTRNPEIRAASLEIEAARARRRQATSVEPPVLSYSAGKLGTSVSRGEREASLRISQGLPFPATRNRAGRVSEIEIALAETNRDAVALRIRAEVTRAYRRLQADLLTIRTLARMHETAADLEQSTHTRLQSGTARYLDVLRPRLERVRLENDRIEAERTLQQDRRALNTLMARQPDASLAPVDSLPFTLLTDSLDTFLARARETRPRLRAARFEVAREEASIATARSSLWPSTDLAIGLDRTPGANGPGFGAEVSLDLPFAPWTNRRARIDESRAQQEGARARLEAAERSLDAALRNTYQAAQSAAQQVASFKRSLIPDAEDALRAAIQSYQYGQIEGLELFETLRIYRSTELEYIRALLNYELSLVDLNTAE